MTRIMTVFLLLILLAPMNSAWAATERYDVAYLWDEKIETVQSYREKVVNILGPTVAKKLKVVNKAPVYGLIYYRNRDKKGAEKVARSHTKLLQSRGLKAATAVRSKQWKVVTGKSHQQTKPLSRKTVAKSNRATTLPVETAARSNRAITLPVETAAQNSRTATQPAKKTTTAKRKNRNKSLEAEVEKFIKSQRKKGIISSDERTAWAVFDFTTGEKLVAINEDTPLQGASLVKTFFALAYFHKVKKGKLKYGSAAKKHMRRMIQRSNNYSANWVLRQAGGPAAVNKLLKRNYPKMFTNTRLVEYIPANGRTYRNKASAHDYSRFLYALWNGSLPYSSEMRRLMQLPGRDRLYTGTRKIPKSTKVINKTGSTAQLCGDIGILIVKGSNGKRYPYTLVGIIEKRKRTRNYGSWIRSRGNVIRKVSDIVYKGISQEHNLRAG
ncbi:MAG: serine hydrolase [Gammaproteobacteria bacterium]|nr:serine hydrolase [Gammaproteobacteria bacterium]